MYNRDQMTHFPPVLTLDSPLCQLCKPSFLLYHFAFLFSIQESLLSSWPWACGWLPMPAPGTPNGSCNYHCSTAVLSVRSPAKQEGILWKSRSKALAFDHEAKGKKPKQCARSTRNVPKEATSRRHPALLLGRRVLMSGLQVSWLRLIHQETAQRVSHATMLLLLNSVGWHLGGRDGTFAVWNELKCLHT